MKPIALAYYAEYPMWDDAGHEREWRPGRLARIDLAPVTILFGRTGCGKTSLLRGLEGSLRGTGASPDVFVVYQPETEQDQLEVRTFITDVLMSYGSEPPNHPGPPDLDDPTPWCERSSSHDWDSQCEEHNARESWRHFLSNEEIWCRQFRQLMLETIDPTLAPSASRVLDTVIRSRLVGRSKHSVDGSMWLCESSRIDAETWREIESCAAMSPSTAIADVCRLLLRQRGGDFLKLHEVNPADLLPPSWSSGVEPNAAVYGSLHTSSADMDLEWFIANRMLEIGSSEINVPLFQDAVRAHLPPFVRRLGELSLVHVKGGNFSHFRIGVSSSGEFTPYRALSSGARSWIALAVSLALSELEHNKESHGNGSQLVRTNTSSFTSFTLLDEPESHLDPLTQLETLRWIESRSSERQLFVIATHSDVFLNEARPRARIYGVKRTNEGPEVFGLDADLIQMVEKHATELGLGRAAVLQTARILLLVEGKHDAEVIRTMFRSEISTARVLVLALGGTSNARSALTEGRFFHRLGTRLILLFDNVRASKFSHGRLPLQSPRQEEQNAAYIIEVLRKEGVDIQPLPFDKPDIICAIPAKTIERAFQGTSIQWEKIIRDFREEGKSGFKNFALSAMGLHNEQPTDFVRECLSKWVPEDGRDPQLTSWFEHLTTTHQWDS